MENGEWRITVRVFRSPFLFIGCYFMAYIYIICTIYAVGCAKVKSNINYNSQVLSVINRMCSSTLSVNCEKVGKDTLR